MKFSIGFILCFSTVLIGGLPGSRFKRVTGGNAQPWRKIHIAAQSGNLSKIDELIKRGTDVNIKDNDGATPLFTAAKNGRYDVVEHLLKNGAHVNAKNNVGQAPIYIATSEGHERVVELLISYGVDVNAQEKDEWTPINAATLKGYERIVELLLKNGANPNNQDLEGITALFQASNLGQLGIVDLLLRNGADINLKTYNDQTPLYTAANEGFENVVALLIKNGADVNSQDKSNQSALHVATEKGFENIVELLIKNGADVNLKNNGSETPIDIGIKKENENINILLGTVRRRDQMNKRPKPGNLQHIRDPGFPRPVQEACDLYMKLSGNRIKGGTPANDEEFPWMAALGYTNYVNGKYVVIFECGGTIISEFFILTACHCVSLSRPPTVVRLGKVTLDDGDGKPPDNRYIKEIVRHSEYSPETKMNDIALIRVVRSIYFNINIAPTCLETDLHDLGSNVKLIETGWGYSDEAIQPNRLQKTQLITMPRGECNEILLKWNRNDEAIRHGISEGQYCAYDPQGKNDSCQGDSGGPVQYFPFDSSAISKVIGVISYGFGCATGKPGINTRVAYYLDWIESIVWPHGFTLPT